MQTFVDVQEVRKGKKMTKPYSLTPAHFSAFTQCKSTNKLLLQDPGQLKSLSFATWNSSALPFYLISAFQIVFTKCFKFLFETGY